MIIWTKYDCGYEYTGKVKGIKILSIDVFQISKELWAYSIVFKDPFGNKVESYFKDGFKTAKRAKKSGTARLKCFAEKLLKEVE